MGWQISRAIKNGLKVSCAKTAQLGKTTYPEMIQPIQKSQSH